MIVVANKKRKLRKIQEENPGAYILDVSSSSEQYEGKTKPLSHAELIKMYIEGNYPNA
jgi:hypothetical protein